jgi:hypothetical protein
MEYTSYIMSAASEYGQLEIIQFLHNIGIEYGDHTMDIACTYGNLEVVEYLYETGMKFDYENSMCWEASITLNKKRRSLGSFEIEIEAAQIRDKFIVGRNNKYFKLNFPRECYTLYHYYEIYE